MSTSPQTQPTAKDNIIAPAPAKSAEETYADLLWTRLSVAPEKRDPELKAIFILADKNGDNTISTQEWQPARKRLLAGNPNHGFLQVMDKIFDNKAIATNGQDNSPITKADCTKVSNDVSLSLDETKQALKIYVQNSPLSPEQKDAATKGYNQNLDRIDSNHNGTISIGEMMLNNNGSFNVMPPRIPNAKPAAPHQK